MKMVHLSICGVVSTEESRMHSIQEGSEQLTDVSQEDLQTNENILTTGTANIHVRFEGATNQQEIPADQYRQYLRDLNDKQKSMITHVPP